MKKKRSTNRKRPQVQYEMTGLAIGAGVGMLVGVAVELSIPQAKMMIMTLGGMVGIAIGASFETVRYWWRKRARHRRNEMAVLYRFRCHFKALKPCRSSHHENWPLSQGFA
jgi:hypothetical protein